MTNKIELFLYKYNITIYIIISLLGLYSVYSLMNIVYVYQIFLHGILLNYYMIIIISLDDNYNSSNKIIYNIKSFIRYI